MSETATPPPSESYRPKKLERAAPLVLVVLGLAVGSYALAIRDSVARSSVVDVATSTVRVSPAHPSPVAETTTTTRQVTSDAVEIALLGAAATLLLAGVFYPRVKKISFGTNSIEIDPIATPEDRVALAAAVAARVEERVMAKPVSGESHEVVVLAVRTASAAAIAQQEADAYLAAIRDGTSGGSGETSGLPRHRRGTPMSRDLLDELARRAVDEAFASEATPDGT